MAAGNIPIENQPVARMPEQKGAEQWRQELSGEAALTRVDRQGHSLRVVAAEHFSQKAADFFQRDIAEEIRDPSQWLFLIEGEDRDIHEIGVATAIAKQKNIPIKDPIFHPFQTGVIELYLASEPKTLPREVVIGHLAAQLVKVRGIEALKEVAAFLGVRSSDELVVDMMFANDERSKDPDAYAKSSQKMQADLLNISNIVSAQALDYYLRQYKGRPNVALYLGKAHEGIATLDLKSIPKGLRFNDEKIRTMIQERKDPRVRQASRAYGTDLPSRKEEPTDKLSMLLKEIPGVSERLKTAIVHWSENLFGLDHVRKRGYQEYLSSENPLHQVWGAAARLADMVDAARRENRDLTSQQTMSKGSGQYAEQGEELFEIANGVQILEQIIKKLH